MSEVIIDVITKFQDLIKSNDFIVLLQPTTPQRKASDIDFAIKSFKKISKKFDSLATVSDPFNHPREMVLMKKKKLTLYVNREQDLNRQKYFKTYFINGSIFISKVKTYKKNCTFFNNKTYYLKTNKKFSIDLKSSWKKLIKSLI